MSISAAAGALASADDSGLQCPRCEYNLTGLHTPRCPECGLRFDWGDPALRRDRPRIAFERARGWRKVPAFVWTAATVVFAPWAFARQMRYPTTLRHAAVFFVVCFIPVVVRSVAEGTPWVPWITTAVICVLAEALLLWGLECLFGDRRNASCHRWLCAGGYTTAIVLAESYTGPVLLTLSDALQIRTWLEIVPHRLSGDVTIGDVAQLADLLGWMIPLVWLLVSRCGRGQVLARCLAAGVALVALVLLYGTMTEYVYFYVCDALRPLGINVSFW